ncbi:MAG: hypothetical protein OXQ84_18460 [bacterium]|nr:hypothetical protein [bacterium]
MIETRPLLSIFLTALLVATMSGCDTFDNPLHWEETPMADGLVGTWKEIEGRNAGLHARVWRADDKTLGFEVTSPDNPRTTFLANVLTAGAVHVLQVRLESYKEFDEDGESPEDPATGFFFVRIAPSEHGVNIHDLDVDTMGRVAERELAASDVTIPEEAYARCLRDSIRDRIWKKALLAGLLSEQEAEAIQRVSARSPEARIDPYPDMARLRTCVAHRLPSESLEQLFLEHADEVFSGETSVFVRE